LTDVDLNAERGAAGAPTAVPECLSGGIAVSAATANVIMQLCLLPIGHAVAKSRVEHDRLDVRPLRRARTTLTYLAVALLGTDEERRAMRGEVNRVHLAVYSLPGDPVAYDAFDPELQLWVAACLYRGMQLGYELMYGPPDAATADAVYTYAARLGTTLQVPETMWPSDRAEFERYWSGQLGRLRTDELTRRYLRDLARLRYLPGPLGWVLGPVHEFFTTGFLPPEFRAEVGLTWGPRRQLAFRAGARAGATLDRLLPRPVRVFPLNAVLWDARRRMRAGRSLV
jgi:uncharacterized protein (DUF2236 family)